MIFKAGSQHEKKLKSNLFLAAGGIVWKHTNEVPKIAVIRRTRNGGDWSLPKGKLEARESFEQAAIREIKEEIRCDVKITSFAGTIEYFAGSIPKIVLFWNMEIQKEYPFKPLDEVKELIWLIPSKAIAKIDHIDQKRLLQKISIEHEAQTQIYDPRW